MKKTVLIVPYFGKFPSYFPLFLKSCASNPDFNWLFFTDDKNHYNYPENTKCIYISFEEIKEIFREKLGNNIVIIRPHKLCDYKVTYGYVFQDWIKEYDFWGHCDIDVIYGKLNDYITTELLEINDKIFGLGHFSLYRNVPEINKIFKTPLNGQRVDLKVFSRDYGYAFDEWHCPIGGINQIFENSKHVFFKENLCANLSSSSPLFNLSTYNLEKEIYTTEKFNKHIFSWRNGILTRYYLDENKIKIKEYPYIHFHKRSMEIEINTNDSEFLIVPNRFIHIPKTGINNKVILKHSRKLFINMQFFKVKYINLKYRIKQIIHRLKHVG